MASKHAPRSMAAILIPAIAGILLLQGSLHSTSPPRPADDDEQRAIVSFRLTSGDKIYLADLLEGVDYSITPPRFTETSSGAIRVSIYAEMNADGTGKSLALQKKKLYPERVRIDGRIRTSDAPGTTFVRTSLKLVGKGVWLKDIQKLFRQKLAAGKMEPDEEVRREELSRLYHWCRAYGLFRDRETVARHLKPLGGPLPESGPGADGMPADRISERNSKIKTAFEALDGAGSVIVRSSKHITVASDWMKEETVRSLLDIGEFICREFGELMYDDEKTAPGIPEEEILRYFAFGKARTMEAALRNASSLSPIGGSVTDEKRINNHLRSGGVTFDRSVAGKMLRTNFNCAERRMSDDPADVKAFGRDDRDWMAHRITHALVDNYFRADKVRGMGRSTMPWIEEGLAIYMTITHLGTYRCLCVDSPGNKGYAEKRRSRSGEREKTGIVEDDLNRIALDPGANRFEDMIRIPNFRNMQPETTAKAFSMVRFMIERDRSAFIRFLNSLHVHYRVLYGNRKDASPFLDGLDGLVAEAFGQEDVENPQQAGALRSVEELEAAWRDWARKPSFGTRSR